MASNRRPPRGLACLVAALTVYACDDGPPPAAQVVAPTPEKTASPATAEPEGGEKPAEQVERTRVLEILGTHDADGSGATMEDIFGGSSEGFSVDTTLEEAQGIRVTGGGRPPGSIGGLRVDDDRPHEIAGRPKPSPRIRALVELVRVELSGAGQLQEAAVTNVLKRRLPSLRICYERQLKKDPSRQGRVAVRFTVGQHGRVTTVRLEDDTVAVPELGECVRSRLARFRYPTPTGGDADVTVTLGFRPRD